MQYQSQVRHPLRRSLNAGKIQLRIHYSKGKCFPSRNPLNQENFAPNPAIYTRLQAASYLIRIPIREASADFEARVQTYRRDKRSSEVGLLERSQRNMDPRDYLRQ